MGKEIEKEVEMVKFFGNPLQEIKSKDSGKVIFRFDTKGEFITDDEKFIERATGHFDYVTMEGKVTGKRVKATMHDVPLKIEVTEVAVNV